MAGMELDAGDRASVARRMLSASSPMRLAGDDGGTAAPVMADAGIAPAPAAHPVVRVEADTSGADGASFENGDAELEEVEGASAPGVVLIEPVLLRCEIGCRYVDDEPVEATSPEDEQRRRYLRRYSAEVARRLPGHATPIQRRSARLGLTQR